MEKKIFYSRVFYARRTLFFPAVVEHLQSRVFTDFYSEKKILILVNYPCKYSSMLQNIIDKKNIFRKSSINFPPVILVFQKMIGRLIFLPEKVSRREVLWKSFSLNPVNRAVHLKIQIFYRGLILFNHFFGLPNKINNITRLFFIT
jgi:hypothetical protein